MHKKTNINRFQSYYMLVHMFMVFPVERIYCRFFEPHMAFPCWTMKDVEAYRIGNTGNPSSSTELLRRPSSVRMGFVSTQRAAPSRTPRFSERCKSGLCSDTVLHGTRFTKTLNGFWNHAFASCSVLIDDSNWRSFLSGFLSQKWVVRQSASNKFSANAMALAAGR